MLAGIEDDVAAAKSIYTKPEDIENFVNKIHVDSLAISIGTSHGTFEFKPEQGFKDSSEILKNYKERYKDSRVQVILYKTGG